VRSGGDELKAKHSDVYILIADEAGAQVVCKRPSRPVYRKVRDQRSDPNKRSMAFEDLFLSCLVHPAPKEFDRVLDEMPALPTLSAWPSGTRSPGRRTPR